MAPFRVALLFLLAVCFPFPRTAANQTGDTRASKADRKYVFTAGFPGIIVTPAGTVQGLRKSYDRAAKLRAELVKDYVLEAEMADCDTTGDSLPKETTTVGCPVGCAVHTRATVWGNAMYKGDSSVCRAAIHHGVVNDETGGFVTVVRRPLGMVYPSTIKNGVKSTFFVVNMSQRPEDTNSFVVEPIGSGNEK